MTDFGGSAASFHASPDSTPDPTLRRAAEGGCDAARDGASDRGLERQRMVREQLRARGIGDERVLAAFARLPREAFVAARDQAQAYADRPLAIGLDQTISQPYMVALMTQVLQLSGSETVLEIGTGSGFQTAILSALAARVYSVERHPRLSAHAGGVLARLGCGNVLLRTGDGSEGWPEFAPFDRVLITCAAPAPPPALLDQLADGGRLVAPLGDRDTQRVTIVDRVGDRFRTGYSDECRFVPLIGRAGFGEDVPRAEADEHRGGAAGSP
ncbi:MAG: protein-L-isoaspartate(D-aspartate) O-methyltransferase [Planctomycetota bacterium]